MGVISEKLDLAIDRVANALDTLEQYRGDISLPQTRRLVNLDRRMVEVTRQASAKNFKGD